VITDEPERPSRKTSDSRERFGRKVGTEQQRAGFCCGFESESGCELQEIGKAWTEPGEIGEALGQETDIVSVAADPKADDFALGADCQKIDVRGLGEEIFCDDPNRRIVSRESMSDRPPQGGAFETSMPFEISQGFDSPRLR
jgi:hypothetical protein